MNRDSILSVYSDARSEYTKQLCVFLVPSYFQFFTDLLEKAKQTSMSEPKRALWQFQTYLNEIHDWNMEKVNQEIHAIHTNCGCDYMEDLLTAVFIAHTKVLTAIRLSSNNKKVEINIPKVEHFLFKALCETSKLLWSSTYLFRDGIPGIEKQQNYRTIETLLNEGILQAIRSLVPVKSILKDFVNGNNDVAEEDSDEEEDKVKSAPLTVVPPPVLLEVPKEQPKEEPKEQLKEEPKEQPKEEPVSAIKEEKVENPTIIIADKPSVSFGQFNTLFGLDHPEDSDMIYDSKEEEEPSLADSSDAPVLQILDEEGTSLDGLDFDSLDPKDGEAISLDDYEEL